MSSDLSFDPEYKNNLSMCPFCGSTNFDDYKDESGDDLHYMTFRWNCLDCQNEWYEEWNFGRRFYAENKSYKERCIMATRSQVKLISSEFTIPIYLYQHYDGYELYKIVNNAISRKTRWDDPEYLARIIFSEMIKDHIDDTTGYGIGTDQHCDIDYLVEVDIDNQRVTEYHGYGDEWKVINSTTFTEAKV